MKPWLKGVDVSYVQKIGIGGLIRHSDSGKVLGDLADFDYVIVKATQRDFVDPNWDVNFANARKAGKPVMAYHYNDNRIGITKQADLFLATTDANADFLWIDQEGTYAFSDAQTQQFIDRVRNSGRMCGLYHSASGFSGVQADAKWVADYRTESLKDGNTPVEGWDMWQFSAEGGPDGLGLDLNWMHPDSFLRNHLGLVGVTQAQLDAANDATAAMAALRDEARAEVLAQATEITNLGAALLAAQEHIAIQDGTIRELNESVASADEVLARIEADRAAARRLLDLT